MASGPQYNWRLPLMTNGYSTDTGGEGPVARLSDEYLSNYNYSPPLSDSGEGPVKGSYTLKPEVAMPQDFMSRFGGAMPTGPMTLADLVKYTGGANNGVTEGEFNQLHPQVQQSILNDPGTFLRGQMGYGPQAATRNGFGAMTPAQSPYAQFGVKQGGNGDLLSLGAEGGSIDPRKMYWDPSVGLVQAPNNYKPINDTNWIDYSPYVIGGMAGFAGAAAGMTGAQAGAIAGGTTGAVAGFNSTGEGNFGDVLKGGVKGAASGYAGGWLGQNGGQLVKDFLPNGTSPIVSNAITGAAKGGLSSLMNGGNIGQGLIKGGITGGINSAVGAGVNASGASGGWGNLLSAGGNYLSGAATNSLFGNSGNSSRNSFNPGNSGNNSNSGGNMENSPNGFYQTENDPSGNSSGGYDWGSLLNGIDFGKTASDLTSAYQTRQQIGQTDRAYNDAKNLILNPSADQQKYRTQLAQLMDNPGSMDSSPLYQSMLDQGMNAVNRTAAAKGQLGSGNRLADLMSAGQKTASSYYFPQQQALASLSGITGDSGQRALGAQSLIAGNNANVSQNRAMLSDLFSGLGVRNQQQQMIDAISGRNGNQGGGNQQGGGGQGSGLINNAIGAVKNWFGGSSDWTPGNYQGFNDSIGTGEQMPFSNWDNQISSWGNGNDNWFGGGGTGGASFNDMTSPINSAPALSDYNSWKLY